MNNLAKFLFVTLYLGVILVGIGLGWAVHPGIGMAAGGVMLSITSFAVGYEPAPKAIEKSK